MNPRTAFVNALIASRVVARYMAKKGMEFDTPEALQKYLKDHPKADKSMHSVKKPEKEEPKKEEEEGEEKPEGEEEGVSESRVKSMTFGQMPSKKDFEKHIREGTDDDDEPLWDGDKGYSMELRGDDEKVADMLDLETSGRLKTPEDVYDYVEKLKDFSDHDDEWYTEEHGIDDPEEIERMRDAAMSLASSIMTTLGYEWI